MPQRFLRPGIRTSPRWNSVRHEAHTLYIAILTLVDDYGRYDGRPSVLWAEAFAVWNDQNPLKAVSPQDTVVFCQELADSKLIKFYNIGGRRYLQVTQWEERARYKSHWPEPINEESCLNPAESCLNPASIVPRPSSLEGDPPSESKKIANGPLPPHEKISLEKSLTRGLKKLDQLERGKPYPKGSHELEELKQ